ncbi:hypothetical protein NA56DRAFT_743049 [Hyaloscypha hepaticicola]|uniref:Uncharacterized protein n=1 Tax=Hyaloscypha hepaticicola TaxID=2082293 RepID=A0A2J6QN86_9HELO|nr:hypothetical protein NA56DRAFT_743049 [Hyaloscypha hepaticicola]
MVDGADCWSIITDFFSNLDNRDIELRMVPFRSLVSIVASLLFLAAAPFVGAILAPSIKLPPRHYCAGVAPSPGGQPCGGTNCPNGDSGVVPPGTVCICNAFRHPGWIPNNQLPNQDGGECTSGIVCATEGGTEFRVCGVSGLEPAQDVPPGNVCRNGTITWP